MKPGLIHHPYLRSICLKLKATIVLILPVVFLHSQTVLNIRVTDVYRKPLPFAVVKYAGTTASSNESGFLTIGNYTAGSKIEIHKLGFVDTTVILKTNQLKQDTTNHTVALRLKVTLLPEVAISSEHTEEINPMKAGFVIGYELKGDYLLELLSNGSILVIDENNKIKSHSRPISEAKDIVKDTEGNIYILTEKTAFKIYPDSSGIKVEPVPVNLIKLNWEIQYCDESTETSRYIRRYKSNNQTVAFFATSKQNNNHVKLLKEISDADKIYAVKAYANETNGLRLYLAGREESNIGGIMGDISPGELELYRKANQMECMLEKNYALPPYSFLKLVNDSIYLFAHDIDSMFVYDQNWNMVNSKRINYHHLKIWDKELIANEERTKVYAKLIEDSKPMIAEIDLQTGELKSSSFKIASRSPSRKIKIRNNVVYFMAKQQSGVGYTVYSQKIQLPR
jgi:hypothetical protein